MKNIFGSKKILITVAAVLVTSISVSVYYAYNWNSDKVITEIEVDGTAIADLNEIENILAPIYELNFGQLDISSLQNEIESVDYVSSAEVYRSGFQQLAVDVSEVEPLAYYLDESGEVGVLADNGNLLPLRALGKQNKMPVFRLEFGELDSATKVGTVVLLKELMSISELSLILSEIVYIGNGQYKAISNYADIEILLGKAVNIKAKAQKLISFWKNYIVGISPTQKKIDLRWGQKIIMY